jgi:hydantoinase/carbamoylase family amidase
MRFGPSILERCDALSRISEDPSRVTRRYLTSRHREAGERIAGWMRDAGMEAGFDAIGNVVGRYACGDADAPVVVTGSHMDTVVDAGRFDGLYGVLAPIACVAELARRGRRLPYDLEVVAFGDEEGVRFGVSMLGSRALAGAFDPAALERRDEDGVSLREALFAFGGDPAAIPSLARDGRRIAAFVEAHIEQGPVLLNEGLPVGIVTSIAGSTRANVRVTGLAGHAGTVPMGARRDALAAAAEMALAVERHCAERSQSLVGTVGKLAIAGGGAINVIPGEVSFTLYLRSGGDAARRAALAAIETEMRAIAKRRDVTLAFEPFFELSAAPCDPSLRQALARSVEAHGITPRMLPSGAGHDAMEFARIAPIAMLFVRCGNGGISHHPAETLSAEDADVGASVLLHFLEHFEPAGGA